MALPGRLLDGIRRPGLREGRGRAERPKQGGRCHSHRRRGHANKVYLSYLPDSGTVTLDLTGVSGTFALEWFDPASGRALKAAPVPGGARRTHIAIQRGFSPVRDRTRHVIAARATACSAYCTCKSSRLPVIHRSVYPFIFSRKRSFVA